CQSQIAQLVPSRQGEINHDLPAHHFQRKAIASFQNRCARKLLRVWRDRWHVFDCAHRLRIALQNFTAQRFIHLRVLRENHHWHSGTHDSGFFMGDLRQRVAEEFLMIEINISNDAHCRIGNVGGVQPSAQSHFEHRKIHTSAGEIFEHDGRDHFEEAWMPRQLSRFHKTLRAGIYALIHYSEFHITDLLTIDLDAFVDAYQVRRRVKADAITSRLYDAGKGGCRGPFSIGACDKHALNPSLRMAQRERERPHLFKIKLLLRAKLMAQGKQICDRGFVGDRHGSGGLWAHEFQSSRYIVLQFFAVNNSIQHAMLQEEFTSLKTLRKFLPDSLLNHAWTGEAN